MSDRSCGSCRHARLGERPVGKPGTPAYWVDTSGRCALADAYRHAVMEYLALCPSGRPEKPPTAFLAPGAAVVAPGHGLTCPAWEEC